MSSYFRPNRIRAANAPRRFTCTRCDDPIDVFELPVPFVDPERFVCLACLDERHKPAQLELVVDEPKRDKPVRVEERQYDPAMSELPI